MCDGMCYLSDFNIFSVKKANSEELFAISHTHGYRTNFVPFAFRIFVLLFIWNRVDNSFSLLSAIKQNLAKHKFIFQNLLRHTVPGKHYKENCKKSKRKIQGVPQSQTAALPRPKEEEETDKLQVYM